MKKNILWTIAIALLLLVLPGINVQAASVKKGSKVTKKNITYQVTNVKNKTMKVIKGEPSSKGYVTIPSTVKYKGKTYTVTVISKNAFKEKKKLTKVTIGKNVKVIASNAFKGCTGLKTVKWNKKPANIKIYKSAFSGCMNYKFNTIAGITYKTGKNNTLEVTSVKGAKVKNGKVTIPNKVVINGKYCVVTTISKNVKKNDNVQAIVIKKKDDKQPSKEDDSPCQHKWVARECPTGNKEEIESAVEYGWRCDNYGTDWASPDCYSKYYRDEEDDPCHTGNGAWGSYGTWREAKYTDEIKPTGELVCSKCGTVKKCTHAGYKKTTSCKHQNKHVVKATMYVKPVYKENYVYCNPDEEWLKEGNPNNREIVYNPWCCYVCNRNFYTKEDDPCKGRDGKTITWEGDGILSEVISKGYYKQVDTGDYQCDDCGLILNVYSTNRVDEFMPSYNDNGTYLLISYPTEIKKGNKFKWETTEYFCKDCGLHCDDGKWEVYIHDRAWPDTRILK